METKACYALGLDIGGSSIKWALVSHSARDKPRVIETGIRPIKESRMPEDVITELADITRTTRHAHGVLTSIGVGIPGMFEAATGIPTLLPNFPSAWIGYHFRSAVTRRLEQPIVLVNDAKAFSIAESVVGAAVDQSLVVCVVLGTGVGGGVVQNGALVTGKGSAGELGHLTVEMDGPPCGCGNNGCVESFAGAAAISSFAGQPSAHDAFQAAQRGDSQAQAAIDRAIRAIGAGLANVFVTLAPNAFVIGGGLAGAGSQLIEPLTAEIRRRVKVAPESHITVLAATLGRQAGAIGAALMSIEASAHRTGRD